MGTTTSARCRSCGHHTPLSIGSGIATQDTYLGWPVSCGCCKEVRIANFKATPLTCRTCRSEEVKQFSDPAMSKAPGRTILSWGQQVLTDAYYRCPRCDEYALRFFSPDLDLEEVPTLWD